MLCPIMAAPENDNEEIEEIVPLQNQEKEAHP